MGVGRPAAGLELLAGLDRAEDDVGRAELLDPHLGVAAGTLAHGEHRDHGRHAEDQAQGRQARAELVQHQALQPELQPAPDASHRERLIGPWGIAGGRAGAGPAGGSPAGGGSIADPSRPRNSGRERPSGTGQLYRGADAPVNRSSDAGAAAVGGKWPARDRSGRIGVQPAALLAPRAAESSRNPMPSASPSSWDRRRIVRLATIALLAAIVYPAAAVGPEWFNAVFPPSAQFHAHRPAPAMGPIRLHRASWRSCRRRWWS